MEQAAINPIEEARIICGNHDLCAIITELFTDAGIAAFGDYREDDDDVLIRDAFADGVNIVIFFKRIWLIPDRVNVHRKSDRDLCVNVYIRGESKVIAMKIGAAVQMILERRHI